MRITSKTLTTLSDPECLFQVLIKTLAADSASFLVGNLPFKVANSYGIALKFPLRLAMPVGFATSENVRFTSAVVHYNAQLLVFSFKRELKLQKKPSGASNKASISSVSDQH